jgi:uncharacterized protein YbjT (DUF2867 family)
MPEQVALVVGPTGATGGPIAAALARRPGWRVHGMCRHAPPDGAMIREQLNQYRDAKRLPL